MSYARWGEDGSDVYVFGDGDGRLFCMNCRTAGQTVICKTARLMLAHLQEHREHGDTVPERAFEQLQKESKET